MVARWTGRHVSVRRAVTPLGSNHRLFGTLEGETDGPEFGVMAANLRSVYAVTRAALRGMIRKREGRIINVTSVVGLIGQAGQANYAASKAGIIGFTKSLAREVASRNVTVNAVAPGFIPTALTDVLTEEQHDEIVRNTPMGRMGRPEEIAWAVAFLASSRSGFVTGHVLTVDGGLVMM